MFSSAVISYIFLVIAIVASTTLAYPAETKNQPIVKVINVNAVSNLKGANLIPSTKSRDNKGLLLYTFGAQGPNNVRLAQGFESYVGYRPKNVQMTIKSPYAGESVQISCVEIYVNQDSNEGQAYVVDGGLGLSSITIVIEANNTLTVEYETRIYAMNP